MRLKERFKALNGGGLSDLEGEQVPKIGAYDRKGSITSGLFLCDFGLQLQLARGPQVPRGIMNLQ